MFKKKKFVDANNTVCLGSQRPCCAYSATLDPLPALLHGALHCRRLAFGDCTSQALWTPGCWLGVAPGRHGGGRRWQHIYPLGFSCWPEVGSACLSSPKATPVGQPSPAASPTAMLCTVAAATPFPCPVGCPCGPRCLLIFPVTLPLFCQWLLLRVPPVTPF